MNRLDAAYMAGFIDGESCLTISKSHQPKAGRKTQSYHALTMITNTDKPILDWFVSKTRRGYIHTAPKGNNHKDQHQLFYGINDTLWLISKVLPYLKIKKRQAELIIEFSELRKKNPKRKTPGINGSLPSSPEYLAEQEALYHRAHELNRRGK